ncbi:MAG: hypothetical protein WDZ85_03365 [Candidatus Paceibacterota bacterium]
MKKIQDIAVFFFILCVATLSFISILGIWEFFEEEIILKSFQTIGLLAIVAVNVIIVAVFRLALWRVSIDTKISGNTHLPTPPVEVNPVFAVLRHGMIILLIISVVLLALFGILAIWEVLPKDIIGKSLASIATIVFASFIIVFTCLSRENHKLLRPKKDNQHLSAGRIILYVILAIIFIPWFVSLMFSFY